MKQSHQCQQFAGEIALHFLEIGIDDDLNPKSNFLRPHGCGCIKGMNVKRRKMPNWPTYMQGLTVITWIILGTIALRQYTDITIWWALFISTVLGFLTGFIALHFWEWVYDVHADSVDGAARYNFGIFAATAIAAVAAAVGVAFQLYKG